MLSIFAEEGKRLKKKKLNSPKNSDFNRRKKPTWNPSKRKNSTCSHTALVWEGLSDKDEVWFAQHFYAYV